MMGTLIPATRRMVSLGLVCGLLFMTSSSSAFAEAAVTTEPGPSSSLEDFQVDTVPQTAHIPGKNHTALLILYPVKLLLLLTPEQIRITYNNHHSFAFMAF